MNSKKLAIQRYLKRIFHSLYRRIFIHSFMDEFVKLSALDEAIGISVNNQVEGDYMEFGVYRGDSFVRAYKNYEYISYSIGMNSIFDNMSFIAFDSFEGLPDTKDENAPAQYFKGAYSASQNQFFSNLKKNGVDLNKVKAVKGFYDKSLTEETKKKYGLSKVSVAYFDVDLYESTKQALDFITPMLQNGSVLVFDDWYRHKCLPDHGVQRACNEWLAENQGIKLAIVHRYRRIAFSVALK